MSAGPQRPFVSLRFTPAGRTYSFLLPDLALDAASPDAAPSVPRHEVRERFRRRAEFRTNAAAAEAEVGELDVGEQLPRRLQEVFYRLASLLVIRFARLIVRRRSNQHRAIDGTREVDAEAMRSSDVSPRAHITATRHDQSRRTMIAASCGRPPSSRRCR